MGGVWAKADISPPSILTLAHSLRRSIRCLVTLDNSLSRLLSDAASPVKSDGRRPRVFVMRSLCGHYAVIMRSLCGHYAVIMRWWLGRYPLVYRASLRRWGAVPPSL